MQRPKLIGKKSRAIKLEDLESLNFDWGEVKDGKKISDDPADIGGYCSEEEQPASAPEPQTEKQKLIAKIAAQQKKNADLARAERELNRVAQNPSGRAVQSPSDRVVQSRGDRTPDGPGIEVESAQLSDRLSKMATKSKDNLDFAADSLDMGREGSILPIESQSFEKERRTSNSQDEVIPSKDELKAAGTDEPNKGETKKKSGKRERQDSENNGGSQAPVEKKPPMKKRAAPKKKDGPRAKRLKKDKASEQRIQIYCSLLMIVLVPRQCQMKYKSRFMC